MDGAEAHGMSVWKFARGIAACGAVAGAGLAGGAALADVTTGADSRSGGDPARTVAEWQGQAQKGDADAQFQLAEAYRLGHGVEQDHTRALALYEAAAQRGHVEAADNFGLLLFQKGEQARAMPLVRAAAERGDPRAQYVLALAHFNADFAERDWVRAYALMTLAQSGGLPQAADALLQMDQYVPPSQRAEAQSLARRIGGEAPGRPAAEPAAADHALAPEPRRSGRPALMQASMRSGAGASSVPTSRMSATASGFGAVRTAVSPGEWQVQLGAFGVAANAEQLWRQLSGNPALAGARKTVVRSGRITRLLATGFASEAEASSACAALEREGQACMVVERG